MSEEKSTEQLNTNSDISETNIEASQNSGNEQKGKKAVGKRSSNTEKRPKSEKPAKKKKSTLAFVIEFFVKIAVTAAVVAFLVIYVAGIYVNHSNSGYPMIKDGDLVITLKRATIVRDDEIAYKQDDEIRFGRVVAMPGDVVDITEESLTVNGYGVYENAVYPTTAEGATIEFPYTVPADSYFVLNDYRSDPIDSRIYGGIPKGNTKGKIFLLLRRRGF